MSFNKFGISLTNLPSNFFYLEGNVFVLVIENYEQIMVLIQKFDCHNNMFYPTDRFIKLKPTIWYELSCEMENELNQFFIIPKELFIHRDKNIYFIQKLFVKENQNYYSFLKERCFLTECQWQNLKRNRLIIHYNIVTALFGHLFTKYLYTFGKNTFDKNTTFKSSDQAIYFFMLSYMKQELSKYKAINNEELWQKYFYVVIFNTDIKLLAKQFWNTTKLTLSTINIVENIFNNVYKMFIV